MMRYQYSKGEPIVLLPSAEKSAATSGTSSEFLLSPDPSALMFECDVTAAASVAGDKLDVYVQTRIDRTNWINVVHFTQVDGDGGAKRYIGKIAAPLAQTMFEASASLAESSVRHILGQGYRVYYVITDGSGTHTFTFSVSAITV